MEPVQEPDLDILLALLGEHLQLSAMTTEIQLTETWPWDLEGRTVSVQAILFERA